MRAGLLSDPRVVSLLRTLFVPVHVSARNTREQMSDPRDFALLTGYTDKANDKFEGGEREAFVLPDGTMQEVFMSLHSCDGPSASGGPGRYTAASRRDEAAVRLFRHRGALALRATHGELPQCWQDAWDGDDPCLRAIAAEAPRWPEPAPGTEGFRVFVRNSYRMYDELHGAEVAPVDADVAARWAGALAHAGDESRLPPGPFVALARAMVPRGGVATWLEESSIAGELILRAEQVDEGICRGVVKGTFRLLPALDSEAGKRPAAACRFRSTGNFVGRFAWDRIGHRLCELRVVATDVDFAWLPRSGPDTERGYFAPWHQVGIEWVRAGPSEVR